jgi:signal peptidase I
MKKLNKLYEPALIGIIIILLLISVAVNLGPHLGFQISSVGSGSMAPTLETGAMVIASKVDASQLKTGDIIIFRLAAMKENNIVHRIIEVRNTIPLSFTTKGDNYPLPDASPVAAGDVIGKVYVHVPVVGYFIQFLKTSIGLFLGLIAPALILIGICSRLLWRELKKSARVKIVKEARL